MEKIRAIIVDDEPQAREGVALLAQADAEVDVLATCSNGVEALEVIYERRPQLVFLDIQMPQINGFEMLSSIKATQRPEVIFITAYDEYTLQAFEVHAVDYLLKPFSDARFYQALSFAKDRIRQQQLSEKQQQVERLLLDQQQQMKQKGEGSVLTSEKGSRLVVKAEGLVHLLTYDQIIWVEAYDYYVKIHTQSRFYLVRDSMKNMESNLPEQQFVRIHKSSIVNLHKVESLTYDTGDMILLTNGKQLKLSRKYRDRFKKMLSHL